MERDMGRVLIDVQLANYEDVFRAEVGLIHPSQIRQTQIRGVAGGATRLVIPESVARILGLQVSGSAKMQYANGQSADRSIVKGVQLTYCGRMGIYNAI